MLNILLDFSFLLDKDTIILLLKGLSITVILALIGVGVGFFLALIPAFMRLSSKKILRIPASIFVDIIRGTPMLVQVFILYYAMNLPVMPFLGIDLGSLIPGVIALIINCTAYISEIVRGGILSVSKGQSEAARSLGLSSSQTMIKIILPQAIKNIMPSLGNEFVTIIKETSIFVVVGIAELMFQIDVIKSQTWKMVEVYIVAGVLYLMLTLPLSKLMLHFEKRMSYGQ
ncbi:Amino acid ABC transporter, permease protein (His/Glu/Gln/Arg/opine family) [Alteracholeplasma palmae J233]|uniref:Amino acid ABC transporter, permease protein (His/Glu/Gln/Arg/opine family) n=1 Tax=Alteracholeplasma palmae (strain ATCC 49389 / J233) TaxID=1318466 RepID=U4KK27_ALTPJ|nr:amino acid ABC transporter permease [Alteracholeplasma palmae]CCV63969.1 Amino acid ABC transporter, permease protein (His/Glu/Gln/Arg/opine family) [Alteracholeplasma palmae J233]